MHHSDCVIVNYKSIRNRTIEVKEVVKKKLKHSIFIIFAHLGRENIFDKCKPHVYLFYLDVPAKCRATRLPILPPGMRIY